MNLQPGDQILVSSTQGYRYSGTVISATNYGTDSDPDWYIEFRENNGRVHYIKQKLDADLVGTITVEKVSDG